MRESLAGLIVVMLARSASAFRIASRLTTAAPRLPTAATRLPTRTLVRAMADEATLMKKLEAAECAAPRIVHRDATCCVVPRLTSRCAVGLSRAGCASA